MKKWLFTCNLIVIQLLQINAANVSVVDLRCCNLVQPEGVDKPLLSWKINSTKPNVYQTAWEIEIASSADLLEKGKADGWKSGKQFSNEQFNIRPRNVQFTDATGYYWRVRIWDNKQQKSRWSKIAYFSIGLNNVDSWSAQWMTDGNEKNAALPYFRKIFNLTKKNKFPIKSTVYFCGLGAGELYLNGLKVDSTRFLDPAQTNYEQYALYSSFDVTKQLKTGDNCVGVMLGNGWFDQREAWQGANFSYGNPMFRLQMHTIYNDGSREIFSSDPSWDCKEGPVLKSNIYLGELYDARKEIRDWSKAETICSGWKKAVLATRGIPPQLLPQLIEPIRTKQIVNALKMWQNPNGNWIFDFGVNQAGIPLLYVNQIAGTSISIRFSEEKKADGSLDFSSLGADFHGSNFEYNYRCKGSGWEQWKPRFSYHGFRFCELSGFVGTPDLSTLKMIVVHSDVSQTGKFECSDSQINKLHELAVRTVLSNLHGIPTDCPNREKCGWLGDTHAFAKMANLNFQMDNFWMKYLNDIRSGGRDSVENTLFHERSNIDFYFTKKIAGLPNMIAPGMRLSGVASPDWGTALVQLPWYLYVYYGNKEVLTDFYPAMKQWTDYVSAMAKDTARTNRYGKQTQHIVYQGLGDWCPPTGNQAIDTPIELSSTAFHYLDVSIMEHVANLLEKMDDARNYASEKQQISAELIANFYNVTKKTFGSQTADILALDVGLVPKGDEKAVSDAIVQNMNDKSGGFTTSGIFGIGRVASMLARNGNSDAAWKILTKKGENSFAWMWENAYATSLWEILPVNVESQKIAADISHNHPMQAGFDACFYEDIAGIQPDKFVPGFKNIFFEPLFTTKITWANASILTPYGNVESNWKVENKQLSWQITIPANSSGLVALPEGKQFSVNGKPLRKSKLIVAKSHENKWYYHVPSGNYIFQQIH